MTSNRRIAKNTLILYIRMFFITIVSLYTSRIILQALGIEDFGIYNIVGGVVTLLGLLNASMSTATQRFLNIKLGECDTIGLNKILNLSITLHNSIALILLIIGESIGVWFFYTQINIPVGKESISKIVYQISLLTACITVIRTPYISLIIAYEKMNFFAYLGIVEVLLKFLVAFTILHCNSERLIIYASYLLIISIIMQIISWLYCKKKIKISSYKYYSFKDKEYKSLAAFSGWDLLSSVSDSGSWQIINIFFNKFLGVTLNAAMGVTNQVTNAVSGLIQNFQMAFRPQIIQRYVSDKESFFSLLYSTSKFSFFLLYVIAFPLIIHINYILGLWLVKVPTYTSSFVSILLVFLILDSSYRPLLNAIEASGNIKYFKIDFSVIQITLLIPSYIILCYDISPSYVMYTKVIANSMIYLLCIRIAIKECYLSLKVYMKSVVYPIALVTLISIPTVLYFSKIIYESLLSCILSFLITLCIIFIFGITSKEKTHFWNFLKTYYIKSINR